MLVLTRKPGEKIVLTCPDGGEEIVIEVVSVDRGRTRIGITASKDVKIFREELLRRGGDGVESPDPGDQA